MAKRKAQPNTPQRIDVQARIDPEALLFIMEQTANAHHLLDQVKKQQAQARKAATPPGGAPAGATPAQQQKAALQAQKAAAQQQQQQQTQQRRQRATGLALVGATLRSLPGGTRSPGRTMAGRFHNNLADLSILPLIIAIVVIAVVIMPVFQGYTRLDLLFMVLSGDAKLSIPPKGSGQNYQQAQAAPPDTSGGNGGAGNPNWWLQIPSIVGSLPIVGLGDQTAAAGGDNTPPATTLDYPGGHVWVD